MCRKSLAYVEGLIRSKVAVRLDYRRVQMLPTSEQIEARQDHRNFTGATMRSAWKVAQSGGGPLCWQMRKHRTFATA